jgi:hypothetical protein
MSKFIQGPAKRQCRQDGASRGVVGVLSQVAIAFLVCSLLGDDVALLFLALPLQHLKHYMWKRRASIGNLPYQLLRPLFMLHDFKRLKIGRKNTRLWIELQQSLHLNRFSPLTHLELHCLPGIKSLEPLQTLTALTHLELWYLPGIDSLEPLQSLTDLRCIQFQATTESNYMERYYPMS